MEQSPLRFPQLAAKTMVCHTITYVLVGMLAAHFLHYAESFAKPDSGPPQGMDRGGAASDATIRSAVLLGEPFRPQMAELVAGCHLLRAGGAACAGIAGHGSLIGSYRRISVFDVDSDVDGVGNVDCSRRLQGIEAFHF